MNKVSSTIRQLLEEHGISLLEQPLRIEAFLRDLHPNDRQSVFLMMEVIYSGLIQMIRNKKPQLDSEIEGYAARMTAVSGVVPRLAFGAVKSWAILLPHEVENTVKSEKKQVWQGTVQDNFSFFDKV